MLSVVDAIAHQTAARNPEDFVERFSERVQALSANWDLLVRNEWQGVNVEDLVRLQLARFVDLIGTRVAVQGGQAAPESGFGAQGSNLLRRRLLPALRLRLDHRDGRHVDDAARGRGRRHHVHRAGGAD